MAKAAGVSRGLVYHYFPNKRDFFSEIVRHSLKNAYDVSTPAPDLPPERWLIDGIDRLFTLAEKNADAFRAIYTSRHQLDDEVMQAVHDGRELQLIRICEFATPGEAPSDTFRLAMEGWSAMLDAILLEWLDGRAPDRAKNVRIAAGSLAGTIVTALIVDGKGDRLAALQKLAPAIFDAS